MIRHLSIRLVLIFILLGNFVASKAQGVPVDSNDIISNQSSELINLLEMQKKDSLKRVELENKFINKDIKSTKEYQNLYKEISILKSKDSILQVKRIQKIAALKLLNKGVAVNPFDSTLFHVYTNIGSYSARDRAGVITQRILSLTKDLKFDPDSLILSEDDNGMTIMWKDQMLMTINENDAIWMNADKNTLANNYLTVIRESIKKYRAENSLKELLIDFSLAILIITVLIFIIIGINKVFILIKKKILANKESKFKGVFIKTYELISARQIIRVLWMITDFVKWVTILIVVYLALPLLFNLFPATEGYAPILIDYFIRPLTKIGNAIVANIPNLITVLVIITIFKYTLRLLNYFANEIHNGNLTINGFYKEWAKPTYQILKVLFLAFMLIVIFPYLPGSDSPIFKGVSVFIGVLFTFGSTGAISNIVAGLVLTYMRSFSIGDRIKIGDVMGDVIEKSLLVTRVRTIKNEVISIPNSQVMNSHTINYSIDDLGNGLIIHTEITISYDTPWQKVHELGIIAALNVEQLEKSPAPFVFQASLDEFHVTYQINAYTKKPHMQALIYSELNKEIMDVFHAAGIELLSLHYTAYRRDQEVKIPPRT